MSHFCTLLTDKYLNNEVKPDVSGWTKNIFETKK